MRSKFKWIFTLVLALTMQFSFAQEKTVTGVVSDATGPLPGANVVIKGTTTGVQTDMDGKYAIKAKAGDVLVFSFIGMTDTTAKVGASNKVNVKMQEEGVKLTEVVVGAMGIKKRKDAVTSTNQVVKAKELTQAANPNIVQSLAGKVSGLQINLTSNGANPDSRIVLRGNRTISGNSQALVVIDNAISSSTILQQLPPEVIESVNVIKGAQGGALYGEQGVNGVIIVTTKKGSTSSKLEVSLNSSVDFQEVAYLPKRQDKYGQGWVDGSYAFATSAGAADPRDGNTQFSPFENGAWGPAFNNPAWAGTTVPVGLPQADGSYFTNVWRSRGSDNIKDFYKIGAITQTGITVNAGGEDGYALMNVSRQNTDFIVENDGMKRSTFLFKGGKKLGKLNIDGSANYTNQTVTQTDSNLLDDLLQTATNIDIRKFRNSGTAHHWTSYAHNPWQTIDRKRNDDKANNFNGIVKLAYEFNKHISVNYTANGQINTTLSTRHDDGFTKAEDYTVDYGPDYIVTGNGDLYSGGVGGSDQFEVSNFYVENNVERKFYSDLILNLDYDLYKDLNMKVNIGNNIQDNYRKETEQGGTQLDVPGWYNIKNVLKPDGIGTMSNGYFHTRKSAGFTNFDFDYKGYLFLNVTSRFEQTSVVKDLFNYPSIGVAMVPTTAFEGLKNNVLNYAKIYANYVKVGNTSPVRTYGTTDISVIPAGFPFGDLSGYQPRRNKVDPLVTPEFAITKEFGGNFGFFNDRITFEGSYYVTDTESLITEATASRAMGATTSLDNTGVLQNKGFELDFGFNPVRIENGFNWNMKIGYSENKTIVKSLSEGINEVNLLSVTGMGIFATVGEEFPSIKAAQYQRDPEGRIIVGTNGIPLMTSTLQKVGKGTPDFIMNFSNSFSYKGISLTAVADYRAGHSIYSQTYNRLLGPGFSVESAEFDRDAGYVVPNSVVNTTTAPAAPVYVENTTVIPHAQLSNYQNALARNGEYSLFDASAIKIREIALSYSLPSKMLKDSGVASFKVGVNARNPFIFFIDNGNGKKNEGYTDPEASNVGNFANAQGYSAVGQYPTTKTYGVSLNITF